MPRVRTPRPLPLLLVPLLAALALRAALVAAGAATPIPDDEARRLLGLLSGPSAEAAEQAVDTVVARGDRRFTAPLLDLLHGSQVGLASPKVRPVAARALDALNEPEHGDDWFAWMEWLAGTELEAPPGYLGWKGRLLGAIDPHFAELLRDGVPVRIRPAEIVWGGVAYEGIPALDRPTWLAPEEASYLGDDEPVFGLVLGGEARAYPQRILDWHEMANDVVGGIPVSLAYCTLCGTGIAFDGRLGSEGEAPRTLDFGSSGFLYRSNKLMVDRQTKTLWNQFTGRPVLGPLADRERRLAVHPLVVARWADWRAAHPQTRVLAADTGHRRPYTPGAAYGGYFASERTMFPVSDRGERARRLPRKARVFGLEVDGVARAWPLDALLEQRVVNDRVAGRPVVLVATRGGIDVAGSTPRHGAFRYRAGGEVRAYDRGAHELRPGAAPDLLRDARGGRWRVTEAALLGPDGARLPRRAGVLAYWFGWSSFHPTTGLYGAESPAGAPGRGPLRSEP